MKKIKFLNVQNRMDYISSDKTKAISAYGELFSIGDIVLHDSEGDETAIIENFEIDEEYNEVKALTNRGFAHISFLTKLKEQII